MKSPDNLRNMGGTFRKERIVRRSIQVPRPTPSRRRARGCCAPARALRGCGTNPCPRQRRAYNSGFRKPLVREARFPLTEAQTWAVADAAAAGARSDARSAACAARFGTANKRCAAGGCGVRSSRRHLLRDGLSPRVFDCAAVSRTRPPHQKRTGFNETVRRPRRRALPRRESSPTARS